MTQSGNIIKYREHKAISFFIPPSFSPKLKNALDNLPYYFVSKARYRQESDTDEKQKIKRSQKTLRKLKSLKKRKIRRKLLKQKTKFILKVGQYDKRTNTK